MASEFEKPDIDFRITLRNSILKSEYVTFEASPDLVEARNVNYKQIDPVHAPGQILAYQNTVSRNFNISGVKLISRTPLEAAQNIDRLWTLRTWTMPQFGVSTLGENARLRREAESNFLKGQAYSQKQGTSPADLLKVRQDAFAEFDKVYGSRGEEQRGRPPAVLLLSAYSRDSATGRGPWPGAKNAIEGHINRVPVVIQNLNISYPSDVDYIPAALSGVPMPTIMSIDLTLQETHSANEYEKFDLRLFKQGKLSGF